MANAALDNVLAEAEAAAVQHTASAPAQNLALVQNTGSALAPLGAPNLTDFVNSGGLSVDAYIMVKNTGVRVGEMKSNLDRIPVIIDMVDITPVYVCRIEVGGNTSFYKSYNGLTTAQGENFQQIIDLKSRSPGAKSSGVYSTVEIPCELAEDLTDAKGVVQVEAGTTLGLTPSLTGFKEFQRFYKNLTKLSPSLLQARVSVNLDAKLRSNKNGNEWYVLEFNDAAPA